MPWFFERQIRKRGSALALDATRHEKSGYRIWSDEADQERLGRRVRIWTCLSLPRQRVHDAVDHAALEWKIQQSHYLKERERVRRIQHRSGCKRSSLYFFSDKTCTASISRLARLQVGNSNRPSVRRLLTRRKAPSLEFRCCK
jgi:hypothetical protein